MPITRNDLLNYQSSIKKSILTEAYNNLNKTANIKTTIFLSHSHHDEDLVESTRVFFASQGVEVYVDWKDPSMPRITSPSTAQKLQSKINTCHKFILLATDAALASNWVPWELGYADGKKNNKSIAIFPVADNNGRWTGSEYVGMYSRIDETNQGGWVVFSPDGKSGQWLHDWLKE